jgi:hypothetical protein
MQIKQEILILADDRPGTVSQSIGLAKNLGMEYKKIDLTYNSLVKIPNYFFSSSLLRLDEKSKKEIKELGYFPSLIISAGRRSATIALYLKKISQGQSKVVQIMDPNLDFSKFDFVILPKHDESPSQASNLITTIGSLTKINDQDIQSETQKYLPELENSRSTTIALLLGGSSAKTKFEKESGEKLAQNVSKLAKKRTQNNKKKFVFVFVGNYELSRKPSRQATD